ncbi:MAG: hypothetical protein WDN04_25820 [Rhodospirillales bacterium]
MMPRSDPPRQSRATAMLRRAALLAMALVGPAASFDPSSRIALKTLYRLATTPTAVGRDPR